MKHFKLLVFATFIGISAPLWAADATPTQAQAATALSEGEVKKIDKSAGKITIRHGELKNLDMPPMTMVFRVQNAAVLDQFQAGDKVNFVAEKIGGKFTITTIEVRQ